MIHVKKYIMIIITYITLTLMSIFIKEDEISGDSE